MRATISNKLNIDFVRAVTKKVYGLDSKQWRALPIKQRQEHLETVRNVLAIERKVLRSMEQQKLNAG